MRRKTGALGRWAGIACLAALMLFVLVYGLKRNGDTRLIQGGMLLGILLSAGAGAYAWRRKKADVWVAAIACIVAAGVIMRIGYMLYTPYSARAYDVGVPYQTVRHGQHTHTIPSNGHAGYIAWLMQGKMPPSNDYQFYQPPLFHMLAAGVCALWRAVSGGQDAAKVFEAGKLVSCWASIGTLFLSYAICKEVGLNKRAAAFAMCVAAFLPGHYHMAGMLNNDSLCVMFMTGIMLYTIRWYRTRKRKHLVMLALCFGLGMMAKISAGVLALVTGPVMAYVLYRSIREGTYQRLLPQYLLFALIAFPLGLWHPVHNYIRFGQPLGYVFPMTKASRTYVGRRSLWDRFGPRVDWYLYARNTGRDSRRDFNVWEYLMRSSVFGGDGFRIHWLSPLLLIASNVVLAVSSLVAMVRSLFRRHRRQGFAMGVLFGFWAVLMASYVFFNLRYPHSSSMHFRYIVPTSLIGAIFLASGVEREGTGRLGRVLAVVFRVVLAVFAVSSCAMYMLI